MKKLMFILAIVIVASNCCNNFEPKKFSCEFNLSCEMKKDYQIMQILEKSDTILDSYGLPIIVGNWYVRSNKTRTFFPLSYDLGHDGGSITKNSIESGSWPFTDSKFDTLSINYEDAGCCTCRSSMKVKLILLGPNYIHLMFDGNKIVYDFGKSKS